MGSEAKHANKKRASTCLELNETTLPLKDVSAGANISCSQTQFLRKQLDHLQ